KDEKRTSFQQKKIEAMLDTKVDKAVYEQVTWPVDILFENNKFAGYVMNKVEDSVELFDLNGPRYAKDITNLDRVAIAQNICSAVNAVHSTGNVVGDMNPKNVLVNPTSLRLTLVDTDSFVIKKNSREFRCGVGRPEYIAPELSRRLHGIGLDTISLPSYTRQTDNFALAIHIFSLLMDSYHPFSCRILDVARESVVCPSKLENIESGFSPFFKQENDFDIPKAAPRVNILPKDIQVLFRKAFIDGYKNPSLRPTPEEWRLALMDLYNDMNNKKIKYFIKGKVNKIKQKLNK
ncbi:MAG: hypothetical protein ACI4PU_02255, partial [Intestinibacter sp.]